jgi:cytochrome c biogenesis protein
MQAGGLARTDYPGFADEFARLVAATRDGSGSAATRDGSESAGPGDERPEGTA